MSKPKSSIGWLLGSLEGADEESERIIDILGFSRITDKLSDTLLPSINTRYYKLKYYPIICLGMDLVMDCMNRENEKTEQKNEENAEAGKGKPRSFFRNYMDYFEHWVAYIHKEAKQDDYIGSRKLGEKEIARPPRASLLDRQRNLTRKMFLTSPLSYAYDRYKTSLKFCEIIEENEITLSVQGKRFANLILHEKGWRDTYDYLRAVFIGKKNNSTAYEKLRFPMTRKLKLEIKRIIIDLSYKKNSGRGDFAHIQEIYNCVKRMRSEPFTDNSFPRISSTNEKIQTAIKQAKVFYELSKPIYKILNLMNIKEGNNIEFSAIFDKKLTEEFRNAKKKLKLLDKFSWTDPKAVYFLKEFYSIVRPEEKLWCLRDRIWNTRGIVSFELNNKGIEILYEFKEKFLASEKTRNPSKYRLDVLYGIMNELKNSDRNG